MSRILVWFSCGAASAVAAKIAVERYRGECPVEVCYCDTSKSEHEDNLRFMADVEKWIGQPVIRLKHPKYSTVDECWLGEKYMVGRFGASCTRAMKREIREAYQKPEDRHVMGLCADEADRIKWFNERFPELDCIWLLAIGRITKEDCYKVVQAHSIKLPEMYRLGYNNNNCIGCVKGGKGYWNKIRRDFPGRFNEVAKIQRKMDVGFNSGGKLFYLDKLDPNEGNDVPEPPIECGIFCDQYSTLVELTTRKTA